MVFLLGAHPREPSTPTSSGPCNQLRKGRHGPGKSNFALGTHVATEQKGQDGQTTRTKKETTTTSDGGTRAEEERNRNENKRALTQQHTINMHPQFRKSFGARGMLRVHARAAKLADSFAIVKSTQILEHVRLLVNNENAWWFAAKR